MLKKAGLKIDMRSRLPRRLILGNALIDNLAKDRNFAPRKRKTIKGNMAVRAMAEVIKKYRCIKQVGKELGISTNKMKNMHICKVHPSIKTKYGNKVRLFLEREDNSTVLPGKRDVKIHKKIVMQKRILNDYLHNLHQKFLMEFPDLKISLSSFCRLRPIHVLPTSFSSRKTCLCTYHQNFALKIKSMQREGLKCNANPDVFIKEFRSEEDLEHQLNIVCTEKEVTYRHWKKVMEGSKEGKI